ncbi:hypothetical protein [Sphingobacterium sp. BN32]|uniref:hypothetical protein n=1 Tax=Sphingobacterium sp. BN32 TaxID=3058432 RepID=UPI00265D2F88|nr:hypothetical protein [Sphingobacterium sp. BN32]WKK59806.1 hypothetical protein QYC40_06090 [Sphingobacterium sp. BN32]
MKKNLLTFLTVALCVSGVCAQSTLMYSNAESMSSTKNDKSGYLTFRQDQEESKRKQGVFFEILGTGLTYSFNYDTRFQNRPDGLGARVGVSYYAIDGDKLFTLPVGLNYLLGKNGHYFELGAGATLISGEEEDGEILFIDSESNTTVMGNLVFGYRKQPLDGGFLFRAGFAPVITKKDFIPYWPYVSFGYSF